MVAERGAAVLGNLSVSEEYFAGLREAGAIPHLVALLECSPTSRMTEIAASTLANLAVSESNRAAIRVAGGVPPLVKLLMDRPSEQVRILRISLKVASPWETTIIGHDGCGDYNVNGSACL
jgi:hypothetical protein